MRLVPLGLVLAGLANDASSRNPRSSRSGLARPHIRRSTASSRLGDLRHRVNKFRQAGASREFAKPGGRGACLLDVGQRQAVSKPRKCQGSAPLRILNRTLLASVQQNDVTKQLAAWAAILAVPTAIAGIYGMNFKYMPELEHPAAYPIVIAVIAGLCGFLYFRFKRSGWL
jgi:hypothetical protein